MPATLKRRNIPAVQQQQADTTTWNTIVLHAYVMIMHTQAAKILQVWAWRRRQLIAQTGHLKWVIGKRISLSLWGHKVPACQHPLLICVYVHTTHCLCGGTCLVCPSLCVCVNLCPLFLVALSRCTRKDWMVEMYQEDCDMDTKDKKGEGCHRRGDSLAHGKMFLVRDTCCCVLDLSLTIASISWDLSTNLQQYALAFHLFSQEAFHALQGNTRWNSSVFYGICWGLLSWN